MYIPTCIDQELLMAAENAISRSEGAKDITDNEWANQLGADLAAAGEKDYGIIRKGVIDTLIEGYGG